MIKYRIIKYNGKFRVQYKYLFFWSWLMSIGDSYISFDTIGEAKKTIKTLQKYDKENGEVVEEL